MGNIITVEKSSSVEEGIIPLQEGKIVAITGCTTGPGLMFAKVCVRHKVDTLLLLNAPSPDATQAEAEIKAEIPVGITVRVETVPCDLQDLDSVRAAAKTIQSQYDALDVLCNNAGIMAVEEQATKDGYDVQIQVNHLSHFLLTKELFPLLQRAQELRGDARIVNHSSIARNGTPLNVDYFVTNHKTGSLGGNGADARWERYHQSKLAQVLFTLALADKLQNTTSTTKSSAIAIKAVAAAPGKQAESLRHNAQFLGDSMLTRIVTQITEDGSAMPLLHCAFGKDVASGDFWDSTKWAKNTVGLPIKVQLTNECTDPDSQSILWKASEDACGTFDI